MFVKPEGLLVYIKLSLCFSSLHITSKVLVQPKCLIFALNVMVIRGQRHINVSKQTTLLAGVDVAPPKGAA